MVGGSSKSQDSADTVAAVKALLGCTGSSTAATGSTTMSGAGPDAAPASSSTLATVRGLIDAAEGSQQPPAVPVGASQQSADAATISFVRDALARTAGSAPVPNSAPAPAARPATAPPPHPPPSPVLGVPVEDGRPVPFPPASAEAALLDALMGSGQGGPGEAADSPMPPFAAGDHELALRASAWLDRKPSPPAFDSADSAKFLVRGEQPPTQTVPVGYLWAQTLGELALSVLVPAGTRARAVSCTFRRTRLRVALASPTRVLLDVELLCPVVPDGCSWSLESAFSSSSSSGQGSSGESTLVLVLEKATRGCFWRCVSEGHNSLTMPSNWPFVGV